MISNDTKLLTKQPSSANTAATAATAATTTDHIDNCYVDTDAFNQFLQCCFDPSHLNLSNATNIIDNNTTTRQFSTTNSNNNNNTNNCHCCNSTPVPPTSVASTTTDSTTSPSSHALNMRMINMESVNDLNKMNNMDNICNDHSNCHGHVHAYDTSSYDSDSVRTHTEPTLPADILNCCTPIDLNPCCMTENHELSNSAQYHSHKCNHNHQHNHYKHPTDLSEMVILNNFFSACCNDSNMDMNDASAATTALTNKYPSLISPPISTIKPSNQTTELYPKTLTTAEKISNLRDSLKTANTAAGTTPNGHHHHLLHLHHHNPEDSTRSHTHDIIFHHHNAHGCAHNNHANHHHHLHFEDQVGGEVIKHDFILPDCDIKNDDTSFDASQTNSMIDPSGCTDFLTSSICNLDTIFNNAEVKLEDSEFQQCFNHAHSHSNISLPSQKKCLDTCHTNGTNLQSHLQHHHNLQHHNHAADHSHEDHFHCHNHPSHTVLTHSGHPQIKLEQPSDDDDEDILKKHNDPLICKWDDCNTAIESEDFDNHLFKNHLQFLPLSPGVYDDDNEYNKHATNAIKRNNMLLHCGWDHCDFTTSDIDKFLEHVPEHTDALKKKENASDESDNEKDVHICQWVDPETGVECGEYFELTEDLTNHIISDHITSGKSSYTCHWKGCSRSEKPFSQRQKIIRHLNTHTKHKPFECEICHKKFSLDLMLKQHMRIHTGEKPYKCDLCGKTFKTSSSLTIHLRIHSGDKPMVCKICGKRFNESSNLNKHMKIHFRKYRCELCLKSFDTETKFKRHQLVCKKKCH